MFFESEPYRPRDFPLGTIRLGPRDSDEFPKVTDGAMIPIDDDDACRLYWMPSAEGPGKGFTAVAVEWAIADSWEDPNGTFEVLLRAVASEEGVLELQYGEKGHVILPPVGRHAQVFHALRELERAHCSRPTYAFS